MSYPATKPIPYALYERARATLRSPLATRADRYTAREIIDAFETQASSQPFVPYMPVSEAVLEREPPPAPRRGRFWLFGR